MRKARRPIETFLEIEVRVGRVIAAEPFPETRRPAYKLAIDFGGEVGVLHSSAQITRRHAAPDLVGTPVLAVVNLPPRRIAGFSSECLVLGVVNPEDPGDVVLVRPDHPDTVGWELA